MRSKDIFLERLLSSASRGISKIPQQHPATTSPASSKGVVWKFSGKATKSSGWPGLVNVYILPWKITIFNGKSTMSMAIFNCYVSSPEGIIMFPMKFAIWGFFLHFHRLRPEKAILMFARSLCKPLGINRCRKICHPQMSVPLCLILGAYQHPPFFFVRHFDSDFNLYGCVWK